MESRSEPNTSTCSDESDLPKQMKEIRLDKIGFNILADTDHMCYALLLKDWQLQQQRGTTEVNIEVHYKEL